MGRAWRTLLKKSHWNEAQHVLNLEEQPQNVIRPYNLARRELGKSAVPLILGKRIVEVYDEAQGALLILGQLGLGKTTLLLGSAQKLLRANADAKTND